MVEERQGLYLLFRNHLFNSFLYTFATSIVPSPKYLLIHDSHAIAVECVHIRVCKSMFSVV